MSFLSLTEAAAKAKELGALEPYDSRISWVWANNFPTVEKGEEFVKWLTENGFEHRGCYKNGDGTSSVRYR